MLLALALVAGCADKALIITYEVPAPRASTPYGLLCVDLEVGDTRNATLVLTRTGMLTRSAPIPKDGPMCVRMPTGTWGIQVTGNPGEGAIIKFPGSVKPAATSTARMPMWWPKKPLEAKVAPSNLTWAGQLCAHTACVTPWRPLEPPQVQAWRDLKRVVPFSGPTPDEPEKKDDK